MKDTQPKRHFDIADALCHKNLIFIQNFGRKSALATCCFKVQGPEKPSQLSTWSKWICTMMKSHGDKPRFGEWRNAKGKGWIVGESIECANLILDDFGLTVEDVWSHFGAPEVGQSYEVHLIQV